MKKKALSKKLRLNKSIVSTLQASQVKGGGTVGCVIPEGSKNCIPATLIDCPPNWTEYKTN